jgi:hypothetical protein
MRPERVLIEVRDRCGGLARVSVNELFRPFEQRSSDRTGRFNAATARTEL